MNFFRFLAMTLVLLISLGGTALAEERLRLATTTSTQASGLLEELLPPFEEQEGIKVDVIAVGTGKALQLGKAGDVDIVMVHAPGLEKKFVEEGYGVNRRDLMYNDFVIVGPPSDPAGIKGMKDADKALKKIADSEETFISRGDQSGTHTKEKHLWDAAGVAPSGQWYLEAGRGMGEVLNMSDQQRAYTLSDRGTFIAYKDKADLQVLVEGDKTLFNPYNIITINPKLHPHINYHNTILLITYLTSPQGQKIIGNYRKLGEQLFYTYE